MNIYRLGLLIIFSSFSLLGYGDNSLSYARNFWYPMYQGQRLSYCSKDNQLCGVAIAKQYCKSMGYKNANEALIDYNVSVTKYIYSSSKCKGLNCNGFTLIRCTDQFSRQPPANYYYRLQAFEFPKFNYQRIDWCYENGKGCGAHTAYSFCRRMGYLKAESYTQQKNLFITKSLGNRRLCFGNCDGFSQIICYR